METEIVKFKDYFEIIRKRLWLISLITIIFTLAASYVCYFVLPSIYQAKTEILVHETNISVIEQNELSENDTETIKASNDVIQRETEGTRQAVSKQMDLIETYKDILNSPRILNPSLQEINEAGYKIKDLKEHIKFLGSEDSLVITTVTEHTNPEAALLMADTVSYYFQEEIENLMGSNNIEILAEATLDPVPVAPKSLLIISLSFTLGLMLSIVLALLLGEPRKKK